MSQSRDDRIYIVGAGLAGRALGQELCEKAPLKTLLGYLDDDPKKWGTALCGVEVLGAVDKILQIQRENPADEAIIAIPSADADTVNRLYNLLSRSGIPKIRILPSISQIIDATPHLIQTREIAPEDLLPRNSITISLRESLAYLRGRRVLITGAGGSIGGEISKQLLSGGAQRLYLLDSCENNIYEVERELRMLQNEDIGEDAVVMPILGDLKDREYTCHLLERLKADVVFHCAAYKHVPMLEHNPVEALKNNIFGTKNLIDAACTSGVSRFVLISTDKAVLPSSVYGVSKAISEEMVLLPARKQTSFFVVRFGNVLGSRGSIVPLFREQIMKGGPLTITHRDMSRFFMTLPEAASLVLQTGGVGVGGNLYILKMGSPLKIEELAHRMIRFYGFEPEEEIPVVYTGVRAGEKLTESLWVEGEVPESTPHFGISKLKRVPRFNEGQLKELLYELWGICYPVDGREADYRNWTLARQILNRYLPSLNGISDEPSS